MYEIATKEPLNFFKIDVDCQDINKKFSKNFKDFFVLEKEKKTDIDSDSDNSDSD